MMTVERAEIVALQALGWMAGQDEIIGAFLGAAGTDIATLKATAHRPETQLAILDFLVGHEAWLRDFCTDLGVAPETPMAARAALPGGDEMHWT